jgi:hypothetical protein
MELAGYHDVQFNMILDAYLSKNEEVITSAIIRGAEKRRMKSDGFLRSADVKS